MNIVRIALLLFAVTFSTGSIAVDESIATIKFGLEELLHKLESLQIGGDEIATNKIEMIANETRRLLKEVERIESGVVTDANETLDEVIRSAHKISSDVGNAISSTERKAYIDVNATLANLNQTLGEFFTIDVKPYLAAIVPPRINFDTVDRKLNIYGYFPKDKDRDIIVKIDGVKVTHSRKSSGIVSVDIPTSLTLKEESFLDIQLTAPTRSGWFDIFKEQEEIFDRVYVQKKLPYSCNVEVFDTNPNYLVTVNANKEFTDMANTQANASTPSVNREVSAEDLFVATVNNATTNYLPNSAKIIKLNESFKAYGGCEHNRPNGSISRWNHESVTFVLNAASRGPHDHRGMRDDCGVVSNILGAVVGERCIQVPYIYVNGGGGTKSIITLKPQFTVNKKGQSPTIVSSKFDFSLERNSNNVRDIAFKDNTSVHVKCTYKDGNEEFTPDPMILKKKDSEESNGELTSRIANNKLYVTAK